LFAVPSVVDKLHLFEDGGLRGGMLVSSGCGRAKGEHGKGGWFGGAYSSSLTSVKQPPPRRAKPRGRSTGETRATERAGARGNRSDQRKEGDGGKAKRQQRKKQHTFPDSPAPNNNILISFLAIIRSLLSWFSISSLPRMRKKQSLSALCVGS